jgi:hypothetical protein
MNNRTSEVQYARQTMESGLKVFLFFKGIRTASDSFSSLLGFLMCIPIILAYIVCILIPIFLVKKIQGKPMLWGIHDFGDCVDRACSKLLFQRNPGSSPRAVRKTLNALSATEEGREVLTNIRKNGVFKTDDKKDDTKEKASDKSSAPRQVNY